LIGLGQTKTNCEVLIKLEANYLSKDLLTLYVVKLNRVYPRDLLKDLGRYYIFEFLFTFPGKRLPPLGIDRLFIKVHGELRACGLLLFFRNWLRALSRGLVGRAR
jgi:hypothetical protein